MSEWGDWLNISEAADYLGIDYIAMVNLFLGDASLRPLFFGKSVRFRKKNLDEYAARLDGHPKEPSSRQAPEKLCFLEGIRHFSPDGAYSGIYFLCSGQRVVYVGQSWNIASRVFTHIAEGKKAFDVHGIYFLPCPRGGLDSMERLFIKKFAPEYNGPAKTQGRHRKE